MSNTENIIAFLGWCTVINLAILIFAAMLLTTFGPLISKMHSNMFNIKQDALHSIYMQYLSNYKIAIFILNLVPYIALKISS